LVFTPDGRRLVVGGPDGLSVWEPDSGRRVLRIPQASDILALGFDARDQQLWTASRDGRIRGWSTVEASDDGTYLRPFLMTERRGRIIRPAELSHSPQQQLPEPAATTSQ
jgi:WD40 repeat protein